MVVSVNLIRDVRACCTDLSGVDAYTGVEIIHPDDEDGTSHELAVYWRDTPPGRRSVRLASFDPLTIDGALTCPCGWSGRVVGGVALPPD